MFICVVNCECAPKQQQKGEKHNAQSRTSINNTTGETPQRPQPQQLYTWALVAAGIAYVRGPGVAIAIALGHTERNI